MASVNYEDIFSSFLGNVTDYNLASLDTADANDLMTEYLHKSLANMYVYSLFSSISFDDSSQVLTYTMKTSINDDIDKEFVTMILGKVMVSAWISPKVQSLNLTAQVFTGKENTFFSQASHLDQLRGLKEDIDLEVIKLIRDRGYIHNSYVGS